MRWRQYRAVWAWVEGGGCRREGILRHFGDRSAPAPIGPVLRRLRSRRSCPPRRRRRRASARSAPAGDLDGAILQVVARAEPGVGRTRCVEILRGGRSKAIEKHSYDGLPHYGAYRDLRAEDVLARGRRAARGRPPALDRRPLPEARGRVNGRRPRLRRGLEPPGHPRSRPRADAEVVAVGSDKPGAQALARAEAVGVADRDVPGRRLRRPRGARPRDGGLARRARRRARRARRLHAARRRPRSCPRSRGA